MENNRKNAVDKAPLEKNRKIDWNKYKVLRGHNITNGTDPAEYISKMREDRK